MQCFSIRLFSNTVNRVYELTRNYGGTGQIENFGNRARARIRTTASEYFDKPAPKRTLLFILDISAPCFRECRFSVDARVYGMKRKKRGKGKEKERRTAECFSVFCHSLLFACWRGCDRTVRKRSVVPPVCAMQFQNLPRNWLLYIYVWSQQVDGATRGGVSFFSLSFFYRRAVMILWFL